jgi:hypothetical protein
MTAGIEMTAIVVAAHYNDRSSLSHLHGEASQVHAAFLFGLIAFTRTYTHTHTHALTNVQAYAQAHTDWPCTRVHTFTCTLTNVHALALRWAVKGQQQAAHHSDTYTYKSGGGGGAPPGRGLGSLPHSTSMQQLHQKQPPQQQEQVISLWRLFSL